MYYIVNQAKRKGSKKHIMRKVSTLSDIALSDFNDNYIQEIFTGNWKPVGLLDYEFFDLLNKDFPRPYTGKEKEGTVMLHIAGKDTYEKLGEWRV